VYGLEEEFQGTLNVQLHDFDTHAAQYQRALDMCTRDWCLQLASDEFLMPGKMDWEERLNAPGIEAYRFNRYHSVWGREFFDRKVYPDIGIRLVRRGGAFIKQTEIHESLQLTASSVQGKMVTLDEPHIIDIGDIRCDWHLMIKSVQRNHWYSGDLYNRPYFDAARRAGSVDRTFALRKEDGHKTAGLLPMDYQEYMMRVIPVGSAIWKELPCRQSE
jgi:hypothetical protein